MVKHYILITWAAVAGFSVTWYPTHPNWWKYSPCAQLLSLLTLNTQSQGYLSTPLTPISDPGPRGPKTVKKREKVPGFVDISELLTTLETPPTLDFTKFISCLDSLATVVQFLITCCSENLKWWQHPAVHQAPSYLFTTLSPSPIPELWEGRSSVLLISVSPWPQGQTGHDIESTQLHKESNMSKWRAQAQTNEGVNGEQASKMDMKMQTVKCWAQTQD